MGRKKRKQEKSIDFEKIDDTKALDQIKVNIE